MYDEKYYEIKLYFENNCPFLKAKARYHHASNVNRFWDHFAISSRAEVFFTNGVVKYHVDGLAQDCRKRSAIAMDLPQSCAKPTIYINGT